MTVELSHQSTSLQVSSSLAYFTSLFPSQRDEDEETFTYAPMSIRQSDDV